MAERGYKRDRLRRGAHQSLRRSGARWFREIRGERKRDDELKIKHGAIRKSGGARGRGARLRDRDRAFNRDGVGGAFVRGSARRHEITTGRGESTRRRAAATS